MGILKVLQMISPILASFSVFAVLTGKRLKSKNANESMAKILTNAGYISIIVSIIFMISKFYF